MKALQNFELRYYWLWVLLAVLTVTVAIPLRFAYLLVRECGSAVVSAWNDTRDEMRFHWSRDSFEIVKRKYYR